MKKILQIIILLLLSISSYSQDDLVWKTILDEQFNNNYKRWHTESSDLRYAQISNGQLIDWFSEKGYSQANRVNVNLNSSKDFIIKFSIANLNNDSKLKYPVYKKRNNGKLKKDWISNPVWGFVWGFKDWNNYNAIIFVNDSYLNKTKFKIYSVSYGTTTMHTDWELYWYKIQNGTSRNVISINKIGNDVLLINELFDEPIPIGIIKNARWYGNGVGPYIDNGAKIALDYVTVKERKPHPKTNWTEYSLKSHWTNNGIDIIEGIYENAIKSENSPKYKLALIESDDGYNLIYLSGAENLGWKVGDIKAYLTKTATPNLYIVKYFMSNKTMNEDLYISFENGLMKVNWTDGKEDLYIKLYPTSEDNITAIGGVKSSGTGFALSSNGYIVTNHHITNGASKIKVRGVKGNFSKTYNVKIIIEDKNNDISIIKIDDPNFTTLGTLPYKINSKIIDVGNSVYALGYPLRATMGDEVKLTNGIISSKTGFQGDITTYQITVPIQPGNSGGPLFDSNGNIIGIINAKHIGAENASYAIKTSYLMNLIQVMNSTPVLPKNNSISNKSLSEQVKFIKEFVFIIEIN